MAYVPVPKDLSRVKTKVLFNLTKRQLICFGSGALIGVPVFFLLKSPLGVNTAVLVMVILLVSPYGLPMLTVYILGGLQSVSLSLREFIRG